MTTENVQRLYSYDDYAAIDDGQRYQVVEGELIMSPSPSYRHQVIQMAIWRALDAFVRGNELGRAVAAPFDVVLRAERPAIVLQPDVLFISNDCGRRHLTRANMAGPPDLVVEVLSPSNGRLDMVRKSKLYAAHGVEECWFVLHDVDRIEVWQRTDEGTFGFPQLFHPGQRLVSKVLPGFELAVDALFAEADELFSP